MGERPVPPSTLPPPVTQDSRDFARHGCGRASRPPPTTVPARGTTSRGHAPIPGWMVTVEGPTAASKRPIAARPNVQYLARALDGRPGHSSRGEGDLSCTRSRPTGALRLAWKGPTALAGVAGPRIAFAPGQIAHPDAAVAAGVGDCNPGSTWPANRQDYADQVVSLVRQSAPHLDGPGPLNVSPTLTAAAVWKARHMATTRTWRTTTRHRPSRARRPTRGRAATVGLGGWGENIAYGYATARRRSTTPGSTRRATRRTSRTPPTARPASAPPAVERRLLGAGLRHVDDSGSVTPPPPPPPSDTTLPTAPGFVTATSPSSSQITLTWGSATDNVGVTGYRVYRGGVQIGTTTSTSYTDGGLAASTTYSYTVRAYDAASNLGPASNTATATTQSGSTPPPPPPPPPPPTGGTTIYTSSATDFSPARSGRLRELPARARRLHAGLRGVLVRRHRRLVRTFNVPRTLSSPHRLVRRPSRPRAARARSRSTTGARSPGCALDRTAGTVPSALTLPIAAPFSRYLGGSGTLGEVRVRVSCSWDRRVPFTLRTDRLTLAYS